MLNQLVIVGRMVKDPEMVEGEDGKKRLNMTLAVQRPYKNAEGIYEADFIPVTMWDTVAEKTTEYCKKGDIIGVKGRVQTSNYEIDGEKKFRMDVVAERVTFLESRSHGHQEQEQDMER